MKKVEKHFQNSNPGPTNSFPPEKERPIHPASPTSSARIVKRVSDADAEPSPQTIEVQIESASAETPSTGAEQNTPEQVDETMGATKRRIPPPRTKRKGGNKC